MGPVVWDDELARVAQKWADQCADVDYKGDYKRKDPHLFHDPHPQRKVGMRLRLICMNALLHFNFHQLTSVTGRGWDRMSRGILPQEREASSMLPSWSDTGLDKSDTLILKEWRNSGENLISWNKKSSNLVLQDLAISVVLVWVITLSLCGKTPHMSAAGGASSSTEAFR